MDFTFAGRDGQAIQALTDYSVRISRVEKVHYISRKIH